MILSSFSLHALFAGLTCMDYRLVDFSTGEDWIREKGDLYLSESIDRLTYH
jgi:hypothetical protein